MYPTVQEVAMLLSEAETHMAIVDPSMDGRYCMAAIPEPPGEYGPNDYRGARILLRVSEETEQTFPEMVTLHGRPIKVVTEKTFKPVVPL